MATFKAVIFKSKDNRHVKSDGTSNVKIKIYHNKESQYVSTHMYIPPEAMCKSGNILSCLPNSDKYNYEIGEIIQNYRKQTLLLGSAKLNQTTCNALKTFLQNSQQIKNDRVDFIEFSQELIDETKKFKTKRWYCDSINALIWYKKKNKIFANEITSSMLNSFIEKLKEEGPDGDPLELGTINNYVRGIRSVFNKCKKKYNDDDLGVIRIKHNPFERVKIPNYRRKRKNVGIEEMRMICNCVTMTKRESIGRDTFMMLFYLMGANIADLYNMKRPVGGRIEYERSKTDTEDNINALKLSIKIEPELKALFEKYSSTGFLSDLKNRYSKVEQYTKASNTGLKRICERLEITKVTTNWSRHTWASLARNKVRASKADVDFCLGHVNNDYKMADIYIEPDYSICDEINRNVIDLIQKS